MKLKTKLILTPFLLLVLLLAAAQAVLFWGLTGLVRKHALPAAEEALGTPVTLEHARLNLLAGEVGIDGITVGNPAAFEEPAVFSVKHAYVDLAVLSLLRQVTDVAVLNIENATLTISRNAQGQVNLTEIQSAMPAAEPASTAVPAQPDTSQTDAPPPDQPAQLPKARVRNMGADLLLNYIDHKRDNGPAQLGLALRLTANDILTFDDDRAQWGRISLTGHLAEDPQAFVINLQGKLAPLLDPLKPSFELNGSIASIDMNVVKQFTDEMDIAAERASMDVALVCNTGAFDAVRSAFTLKLVNARLIGKTAEKNKIKGTITNLSLTVPVAGTLDSPSVDWAGALGRTLMQNIVDNPEAILQALDIDQSKIDKEVDKGLKKLGDFLNKL